MIDKEEFQTRLKEAIEGTQKLQAQFDTLCSLIKASYNDFEAYHTTLSFMYPKEQVYHVIAARVFLLDVEPGIIEKAHQYVKANKQN